MVISIAAAWASEMAASGASKAKVSVLLKGACARRGAGLWRFKINSSSFSDLGSLQLNAPLSSQFQAKTRLPVRNYSGPCTQQTRQGREG